MSLDILGQSHVYLMPPGKFVSWVEKEAGKNCWDFITMSGIWRTGKAQVLAEVDDYGLTHNPNGESGDSAILYRERHWTPKVEMTLPVTLGSGDHIHAAVGLYQHHHTGRRVMVVTGRLPRSPRAARKAVSEWALALGALRNRWTPDHVVVTLDGQVDWGSRWTRWYIGSPLRGEVLPAWIRSGKVRVLSPVTPDRIPVGVFTAGMDVVSVVVEEETVKVRASVRSRLRRY